MKVCVNSCSVRLPSPLHEKIRRTFNEERAESTIFARGESGDIQTNLCIKIPE